ncbi:hypothetical protein [Paenibacillus polymyxa]|uniref:hypothetical protein n=1 Tax=Paenibacillus polymyxa TaxID=1406 RepID=UPI002ED0133F
MQPGMALNEEVAAVIMTITSTNDIKGELGRYRSYSSDPLAATVVLRIQNWKKLMLQF